MIIEKREFSSLPRDLGGSIIGPEEFFIESSGDGPAPESPELPPKRLRSGAEGPRGTSFGDSADFGANC